MQMKLNENNANDKIPIGQGVKQGDAISPKLIILAIKDIFKLSWNTKVIYLYRW